MSHLPRPPPARPLPHSHQPETYSRNSETAHQELPIFLLPTGTLIAFAAAGLSLVSFLSVAVLEHLRVTVPRHVLIVCALRPCGLPYTVPGIQYLCHSQQYGRRILTPEFELKYSCLKIEKEVFCPFHYRIQRDCIMLLRKYFR